MTLFFEFLVDQSVTIVIFSVAFFCLNGQLKTTGLPFLVFTTGLCALTTYSFACLCDTWLTCAVFESVVDISVTIVIVSIALFVLWLDIAFTRSPRAIVQAVLHTISAESSDGLLWIWIANSGLPGDASLTFVCTAIWLWAYACRLSFCVLGEAASKRAALSTATICVCLACFFLCDPAELILAGLAER